MFENSSRYFGIEEAVFTAPDGREIRFVRRRFVPNATTATTVAEHTVSQGERLDNITARYLSDPEQFWRVCDANNSMKPEELTNDIGRRLRIALPQSS